MIQLTDKKNSTPAWIKSFIVGSDHPCLMAQLSVKTGAVDFFDISKEDYRGSISEVYGKILRFILNSRDNSYSSFILSFSGARKDMSEVEFENFLWNVLSHISQIDSYGWDPNVSRDPSDPEFSFSIGGKAFYIIGMHPNSSRKARRTPVPVIVFNLHSQFERLRATGKYESVRNLIRARDKKLQGSVNPMVSDFGTRSEANQYSGRQTGKEWVCPFHNKN